ncbi:hypothetical protein BDF19DRAFT_411134 [Syncephalis fuscata]|nr:hypothetical protein BDF19DRAFT_411134 [Syncephalis fuscata]
MRVPLSTIVAFLTLAIYSVVDAAPSAEPSGGNGTTGGKVRPESHAKAIAITIGSVVAVGVMAVGLFMYRSRRNQKLQEAVKSANTTGRASIGGRGGMRASLRPSRSSSIMLRHAVQNNSNNATFGGPTPSMKRGGRRKGAPTAIMVEVPPASVALGVPVATPSGTGAAQRMAAQRTVGLHVPPSPAYDFRGRGNEMPVTPRTPCMTMPTAGNAVADRMV